MRFAHLLQSFINTPLAIHPAKAEMILAALSERMGAKISIDKLVVDQAAWEADDDFSNPGRSVSDCGYELVGGVAIIPIQGTLVQKLGSLRPYSGMTGYDGIRQAFLTAIADDDAKAVMFDVQSAGGLVAGNFDLVDTIYDSRGAKPIAAILTEYAYSAAYGLASAVDPGRIYVPRTGGTGSVATMATYVDMSKGLKDGGIQFNFFVSDGAERKLDGHAEIPMSDDARAAIQAEVNEAGEIFYDTVARNRGLTVKAVKGLKGGTFMGANGLRAGLADHVMAPDAAFRALVADLG